MERCRRCHEALHWVGSDPIARDGRGEHHPCARDEWLRTYIYETVREMGQAALIPELQRRLE